jgi:sec-independent protein translocase protein TatC
MSDALFFPAGGRDVIRHFDELRRRIIFCALFFLFSVAGFSFQGRAILSWLEAPARAVVSDFIFTSPTEAFTTYVAAVLFSGAVVTFPVCLYHAWAFLAPAFPQRSRTRIFLCFVLSLVLFTGGGLFSYFTLLPAASNFLISFARGIAVPLISLSEYIRFALFTIFLGGWLFQIPLFMGILSAAGILRTAMLRGNRRYIFFGSLVVSAMATPTQDVFNMMLLAVPMMVLFELGAVICSFIEKKRCTSHGVRNIFL